MKVKGKKKSKNRRKRDINLSQSTMNSLSLSTEEVEKLKKQFMQDYYPGLEMNQLVNLVGVLAADDPEKTLQSKVITDPETLLSSLGNYLSLLGPDLLLPNLVGLTFLVFDCQTYSPNLNSRHQQTELEYTISF